MSTNEKAIEGFAELVHHYHTALARDFGCQSTEGEWNELTSGERKRLVAAIRLALLESQAPANGDCLNIFTSWPSDGSEGKDCGC